MKTVIIIFQNQDYQINADFATVAHIEGLFEVDTETDLIGILAMETRYLERIGKQVA